MVEGFLGFLKGFHGMYSVPAPVSCGRLLFFFVRDVGVLVAHGFGSVFFWGAVGQ